MPVTRSSAAAATTTTTIITTTTTTTTTTKAQTSPSASRKQEGGRKRRRSQSQKNVVEEEKVDDLVEGFGKNFLVFLVMEAVSKDHDFIHRVRQLADEDPAQRMLCVNIPDLDVTDEALRSFFERYGEIESFSTRRFRWVSARILFKHRKAARMAVKDPRKNIGNRQPSCGPFWCYPSFVLFSRKPPQRIFTSGNESMIPSFPSMMNNYGDEEEGEPLMELVQSFGDDYLMVLVKEAISKVPDFIKTVEEQADLDPVQRQVYVNEGIGFDHPYLTDDEALEALHSVGFGVWGEIEHCQVEDDYAYVQFKHRNSVLKVMEIGGFDRNEPVECVRLSTLVRPKLDANW
ncbi:hypothetical protein RHGRI_026769 [Rhododendron griersonianum]|uniref:RRM domain-containing protein n=1 Tax=Rhododendron griersonianum TaxID=479676 RepID=A0AAV6ITU6_9ERIC|nr:hypothetical protein RHGRI_026769 [Rhododendron griersonianum]